MKIKKEKVLSVLLFCFSTISYGSFEPPPPPNQRAIPPPVGASIDNDILLLVLAAIFLGIYFTSRKKMKLNTFFNYLKFKTGKKKNEVLSNLKNYK